MTTAACTGFYALRGFCKQGFPLDFAYPGHIKNMQNAVFFYFFAKTVFAHIFLLSNTGKEENSLGQAVETFLIFRVSKMRTNKKPALQYTRRFYAAFLISHLSTVKKKSLVFFFVENQSFAKDAKQFFSYIYIVLRRVAMNSPPWQYLRSSCFITSTSMRVELYQMLPPSKISPSQRTTIDSDRRSNPRKRVAFHRLFFSPFPENTQVQKKKHRLWPIFEKLRSKKFS